MVFENMWSYFYDVTTGTYVFYDNFVGIDQEYEYNINEILPRGVKNVSNTKIITVTVMVNNMRRDMDFDRNNPFREFDGRNPDKNSDRTSDRRNDEPTASIIVSPTASTTDSNHTEVDEESESETDKEKETTVEEATK